MNGTHGMTRNESVNSGLIPRFFICRLFRRHAWRMCFVSSDLYTTGRNSGVYRAQCQRCCRYEGHSFHVDAWAPT